MQTISQGRKDKENFELMVITNEELKLQNKFLTKESDKIKEILKKMETNRVSKTEIYKTVHEIDHMNALQKNPHIETMLLKAILSDFELFRLRMKIDKFEGEITSLTKKQDRVPNSDNDLRKLHYKELAPDESKFLTDGNSFTMSGDQMISEYRR